MCLSGTLTSIHAAFGATDSVCAPGIFQAALSSSIVESAALRGYLSVDALQEVQAEMLALRQRHRFRQYVTQLARHIEAMDAPK